jgi:hypothetical protein
MVQSTRQGTVQKIESFICHAVFPNTPFSEELTETEIQVQKPTEIETDSSIRREARKLTPVGLRETK